MNAPLPAEPKGVPLCADCGGFDVEWMRFCSTHNLEYCRGCDCPGCAEEALDDDEINDDGAFYD